MKKTKKKKNKNVFWQKNKGLIIRIVILLLSIFATLQAGFFGSFLYEMIVYLFGDFTYLFLIFATIFSVFLVLDKESLIIKNKYGQGIFSLWLASFFYLSYDFYKNVPKTYSFSNLISDIGNPDLSNSTGIFGWVISFSLVKLIGLVGLVIIIFSLLGVSIYLLIDFKKLKKWFEFSENDIIKENDDVVKNTKNIKDETDIENDVDLESKINNEPKQKKERSFIFSSLKKEKENLQSQTPHDPLFTNSTYKTASTTENKKTPLNSIDDPMINAQKKVNDEVENILNSNIDDKDVFGFEKKTMHMVEENLQQPIIQDVDNVKTIKEEEIHNNDIPIFMQESADIRDNVEELAVKISEKNYAIPSVNLLNGYGDNSKMLSSLKDVAKHKATLLKTTLESFGLNVEILNIHIGPNVTKYELQPEMGVKVAKFNSLSNDIALALAAKGVRIEAPIPGKAAVGIEIANDETMMVSLKEVLLSNNNDYDKKLQIGLGKDISGNAIFTDITKTPHLLVAGSTGSGKSVCINSIIISILTKASPDEVKLILIDPKKVELTPYNGIPHLLAPVVTEPKKAISNLAQMVAEMEWRYELFAETNTRNIDSYNKKVLDDDSSYSKIPYIVIIIDELADLMMVASKEVETSIARLAQMARAAGIHLIIATQRPSTDVITGLIKANIPSRIAFAVSSGIDSRTILDSSGAEKLLGRGDMLYSEQGSNSLHRIQGAYLSDEEVELVVNQISQQFTPEEIDLLQDQNLSDAHYVEMINANDLDEIYDQVKEEVIKMQKASTSQIQRRFKVGYNRAANIMDQLEANGVISESEGTKPRRVLINEDEYDN